MFVTYALSLSLLACARQPVAVKPVKRVCVGRTFDLDHLPGRCVHRHGASPPASGSVETSMPLPVSVESGRSIGFDLEMRNTSKQPVELVIPTVCDAFEVVASNESATSLESECASLCRPPKHEAHLTLLPGGVVRKVIVLEAVRRRIAGTKCVESVRGPLPPGRYRLEVKLPWMDAQTGKRAVAEGFAVVERTDAAP